jgi:exopolysaccharide production protein ExoZ
VLLGAASYAIYLVHNPALSVASRVFSRIDGLAPGLQYALVAAVALAAGLAYYLVYERHALRVVRGWLAASAVAPAAAAPVPLKDSTTP